jgi:hypothetical protein
MSGIIPSDNKFADTTRKALTYLKELAASHDGWSFNSEKDNVKIYTKEVEGGLPMTRGDTVLEAGWTLEQIGAIAQNTGSRAIWDERFEFAEIKERYTRHEILIYSKLKGTWPVSGRDVVATSIAEYKEGEEYIIAITSVEEPTLPPVSSYVRANSPISGWVLKPLEGGAISMTYIVHVNLNGSIPSAFVKKIQIQTPLCAGKVVDYARKFGFPPYIKALEGRIRHEEFNHAKQVYSVEVDAIEEHGFFGDKTGSVVIEVSKKMFPNGFTVKTSVSENIHEKEEADGNTLITIKKIKAPVVITVSKD